MTYDESSNETKRPTNAEALEEVYYDYHGEPSEGDIASELYGTLKGARLI